ncbi:MAG: hypothetical protein WDZ27_06780 [Waddliaceae bacterium]
MPQERKEETVTSDNEIKKMLSQMHFLQDDMQKKFESILEKVGKTPQDIENFFANPDNFSDKEWNRLQKHRKELDEKVNTVFGESRKKEKVIKKEQKGVKKRKGKSLGDRKGWMKM